MGGREHDVWGDHRAGAAIYVAHRVAVEQTLHFVGRCVVLPELPDGLRPWGLGLGGRLPGGDGRHPFWADYREAYRNSLSQYETGRLAEFDRVFFDEGRGEVSPGAMRAALFITIYRNLPIFHLPFELLNTLSEIDELLSNWRYRHFMMVRRMIGIRIGTGGTSGAGYLEGTLNQHYAFREITEVATFLIERSKLPSLPNALKEKVSFNV